MTQRERSGARESWPAAASRVPGLRIAAAFALMLAAMFAACGPEAPPALVSDSVGLLDDVDEASLADYLSFVRHEYGIDYRVIVVPPDLRDPDRRDLRAEEHFEALGVGEDTDGRGLLLVVQPHNHLVQVEVGYALEPFITDLEASRMISDYVEPWLNPPAALEAGVEALVDKIKPHLDGLEAAPAIVGSGGAGARADVEADAAARALSAETEESLRELLVPQASPRAARDLELAMMHRGFYYQQARLYDAEWRAARRGGNWSPSRLQEIARQWDRPYEILVDGNRAVAYYTDAPALGPTLLRREAEGWLIDATSGAQTIVYDYSNDRWYAIDGDGPYLPLLARVFDLRAVELQGGRRAWMIDQGAGGANEGDR